MLYISDLHRKRTLGDHKKSKCGPHAAQSCDLARLLALAIEALCACPFLGWAKNNPLSASFFILAPEEEQEEKEKKRRGQKS